MHHTRPTQVLGSFWLLYTIVIIFTYTSTLIAFLTVPRIAKMIESLEELSNQKEILWTYRANTAHDNLFSVNINYFYLRFILIYKF